MLGFKRRLVDRDLDLDPLRSTPTGGRNSLVEDA